MFPTAFLLAVIAALTIIVALQVAASIRVQRKQREADRKTGRAIGELFVLVMKSGAAAIQKAHKRGYAQAITDITKPLSRSIDNDVFHALMFGSPTGRFRPRAHDFASFAHLKPDDANGSAFSIADLEAALASTPRYSGARPRDPFAWPLDRDLLRRQEFGLRQDTGGANPLDDTDPVERTAADQVAGDGGVASEAEANAATQAEPLPQDYATRSETHPEPRAPSGIGRQRVTAAD